MNMNMDKENVKPSLVRVPLKAIADKGKGKRVFVDEENFMYLKNKDKPNGVTYLHCRNKKDGTNCKVCALYKPAVDKECIYIYSKYEHNHVSHAAKADAYILESETIKKAVENPTIEPRTLYKDMIGAKLLTNVKHALTSQYNFTAKLVTERKEAGIVGDLKEPKTFKELAERYPEELKVTISDEKFLIYTGYGDEEQESLGFLVFASPFGIDLLNRSKTWLSDGTFTMPSGIFEQMYVVHGLSPDGIPYPAAYFLLADKSAKSYRAGFQQLSKLVRTGPETVIVDLEHAPMKMYMEYWPEATIETCEWHWKRALKLQLGAKGCLTYYNKHTNVQKAVDTFKALAYVPADKIVEVFDIYVEPIIAKIVSDEDERCPEEMQSYFSYIETTYIGKFNRHGRRSRPLFTPDIWSKFEAAKAGRQRTSNSCENWHSCIQSQVDTKSIWKFIEFIRKEDNLMDARHDRDLAGIRRNSQPGPLEGGSRKILVREKVERLKNMTESWGTMPIRKYLEQIVNIIKSS